LPLTARQTGGVVWLLESTVVEPALTVSFPTLDVLHEGGSV